MTDQLPIVALHLQCDGRPECVHPATHIAHIHNINHCDADGLTPYGDTAQLLCVGCLKAATEVMWRDLKRRNKHLPKGCCVCCRTCGRPIHEVPDVFEIEDIR
jgi:hypothetical protein